MKNKELRIGNYVNYHGGSDNTFYGKDQPRHLAVITKTIGHLKDNTVESAVIGYKAIGQEVNYYHKSFEPIPLTEKWLIDLGIEKNIFSGYYEFRTFISFKIDIFYKRFQGNDIAIIADYEEVEIPICNIKYVHQLQNLYFALTGQELELKSKKED